MRCGRTALGAAGALSLIATLAFTGTANAAGPGATMPDGAMPAGAAGLPAAGTGTAGLPAAGLAGIGLAGTAGLRDAGAGTAGIDPSGLGATAAASGRYFGAAVNPTKLNDPVYTGILDREFNSFTPENVLEWDVVEQARNQFVFTMADRVVSRAESTGAQVRGRGLVGPSANHALWLSSLTTAEAARSALRQHITVVLSHYRGRIKTWDVVSEAFYDNGSPRYSVFERAMGMDYVAEALTAARAADPTARLCYNDYNIEDFDHPKTQVVYAMVKDFKSRGVPIDCVGLQSHFVSSIPIPDDYQRTLAEFAALGVDVEITELDITGSGATQADAYHRVVSACTAIRRCTGITVWGVRDIDSWRVADGPLLFDRDGNRKPAYYGALSAL